MMKNLSLYHLVLFVTVFWRFCSAGYCPKSYHCTGTCYTDTRYYTSCGLFGWQRCKRTRSVSYSCAKVCYKQECCEHYTGSSCTTPQCGGSTSCPNGGTCQSPNYCSCSIGYASPVCSDIIECASDNGGCKQVCINTHGSYTCSCRDGYVLSTLTDCIDIDECILGTSGCEQTCTNTVGSFKCGCREGYALDTDGKTCLDDDECSNGASLCQHNCTNAHGSYTCSCNDGYSLALNRQDCEDIDECSAEQSPCDHGCHNEVGTFSCSCNQGYELGIYGHTCNDVDECITNNGGCGQDCNNLPGTYTCGCNTGYSLQTDGQTCIDIDECEISTSDCQQTCTNTVGSYNCGCNTGYNLNVDQKSCYDIDDCVNIECRNGGICIDGIDSYTCSCVTGFTGQHCQSDIDECIFLNGGCQDICTNSKGGFVCDCSGNRTLDIATASCIGAVTSATVFQRHKISRKLLPRGCSTLLLSTCPNDGGQIVFLSSTSFWFSLYSDERISYSSGIVFAEVGTFSIPISLTGVTVKKADSTFTMSMTTSGFTADNGSHVGNERTSDCLSFELTSGDLFDFISSNSFLETLLTSLVPQLPEWLEFATTNHSIIDTQDLRTDLVYGRDINKTRWCEGAPVISDHVYSLFRFGADFNLSIYGNSIGIPKPLDGHKFCIIIDICQHSGGSIFIMIPEESKKILTGLDFFKTLYEEQDILIYPRGLGFTIANGINVRYAPSELALWNGDRMFTYPVFETGDIWLNADFIYNTPDIEVEAQLAMYLDVDIVDTVFLGMYINEWNLMVNVNKKKHATFRLKFEILQKNFTLVLDDLATVDIDVYMSMGGTEPRLACGDVSNPPGIFLSAALKINPFQGVPVLEDWVFDNTYKVFAFLTIDQDSYMSSETTIDILDDILHLKDRLARFDDAFQSTLQQYNNILTNTTQSLISHINQTFNTLQLTISNAMDIKTNGNSFDRINLLSSLWSTVKQTQSQIIKLFDELEFNVDIVKDNFTSFLKNEIEGIRSDISGAVTNLTHQVNALIDSRQGFGLKFTATVHILGLKLIGLDIEMVNSVSSLGKCSRFDKAYSLFKGEEAVRFLGRLSPRYPLPIQLGYFLKFLNGDVGAGFGGAFAKHSNKWLFQKTAYVNFLGIKTTHDIFLSSDKKLFSYFETNIWDIFFAQLDVTAELGEDWYKLKYKIEGRFVANVRRKRQTQTVSTSFQGSYLDALKEVVQNIADDANKRIEQAKQIASFAQQVLSGAQDWMNKTKSQVQNANSAFDSAVGGLESVKQSLEDAKGPYYDALRKLENAQIKVDKLCKIRSCPGICVPGIRWGKCRVKKGWISFSVPCPKLNSCMFKVPDIVCHGLNFLCYAVRTLAFIALEAAKLFVRVPMFVYDTAISALSIAQIAVDKSRFVLVIAEGLFDLAVLGLEGAKLALEAAKIALEAVKFVIGVAVKVLEFVVDYGLKNLLDVRNCGFSIELSTTDLPIFDVSCEVNAFKLGWKTIRMKINFQNIGQSIWQAAKATINKIIDVFGSLLGRKRREILYESSQKIHILLRKLRETDQYQNLTNFITSENETADIIDIIESTQGMDGIITSTFDQRVNLFDEKCKTILSIKSLLENSFPYLLDSVSEIVAAKEEALLAKEVLIKYNLDTVLDNVTLENSGISLDYAMTDYNLTEEDLNNVLNDSKTSISTNPLMIEINDTISSFNANIDDAMASIEYFNILNEWINAMDNMTKEFFEVLECVGFRDCVFHSISTLYDLFTYEDHPNVIKIQTSITILEDNILELFSNESYNISTIYVHSDIIVTNIQLIFDLQMFCSTAPTIITKLVNETATFGTNTFLRCHITADPSPDYWWFKKDDLLIGENTERLHFLNVTYQDEGIYKCIAGNIIGNVSSSDAFLSVKDQVSEHDESEEQEKGSGLLIGLLVGTGVVISIVIAGIVIIRWKSHQRKLTWTLQYEASFVSLNMKRPDVGRQVFSIDQYRIKPSV